MRINFLRSKAMSAGACNPNPRDYCSNTSPKRSTAHSVRPCQRNDSAKAPNPTIERDARKSGARPSLRTSYGTSHSSGDQVRKLTKCSVLCAVAHLLFGCAGNQPSSVPQLGNVPIGASLAKGQLQEIHLLSIDESRSLKDNIWISGKGYAKVNGGSAVYFRNIRWQVRVRQRFFLRSPDAIVSYRRVPYNCVFEADAVRRWRPSGCVR